VGEQRRRRGILTGRVEIGFGLFSFTLVIAVLSLSWFVAARGSLGFQLLALGAGAVLIGVLWTSAVRNGRAEKLARVRLQEEHPGALVERVRLWSLPHGKVDRDMPIHFLIADPREISFETIDRTVLLRIPVAELGFVDPTRAQKDARRDNALTLIYDTPDDEQAVVQLFTLTYAGIGRLRQRVRTAIAWPADGTPP
jgi:hypothetical protein